MIKTKEQYFWYFSLVGIFAVISWVIFLCGFDIRKKEEEKRLTMVRMSGVQDKAYRISKLGGSRASTLRGSMHSS